MSIAVIINLEQARIFAHSGLAAEVVSFCPSATHYLREKHFSVTSTASLYTGESHAENVMRVERELALIVAAANAQYQLDYAESEGLRVYMYHSLCCVYHLHLSLTGYDKPAHDFYWVEGKKIGHGSYAKMFTALALRPPGAIASYAYTDYSAAHGLLASFYNRIICAIVSRSARLRAIDFGDELPKRIVRAMVESVDTPLIINTRKVAKNPAITTRFFIKSLVHVFHARRARPVYVFRVAPKHMYRASVAPFNIPALSDAKVQEVVKTTVERFIPFTRTEVRMGRKLVEGLKPDIAVSDHAKYVYILGGLETLHAQGGLHAMINHGTHTVQYDPISKKAANLWASQERSINRNTTHSLPKSPLTEKIIREIAGEMQYQTCKINMYGKIEDKSHTQGKFVVLQAGNYTDVYNHIPWCKETADEYLLAIFELLEEVGKLENVELIIKLKNKKADTHKAIVEEHIKKLGIGDKARVDTTGKFSELMARAHLVVCNLSGTVEEALVNRIPVMVHTYRKGYFHIPEEVVQAAAKGALAPAYLVKNKGDIEKIITTLSGMRAGLRDPELYRQVAWQENELTSLADFAKDLVHSARQKRGQHGG